MYAPNRKAIFEDMESSEECDKASCSSYRNHGTTIKPTLVCTATAHGECNRVNLVASEVNQFIKDNDDVFMYIQPVGE